LKLSNYSTYLLYIYSLSGGAPESALVWLVCGWNPLVSRTSPKPPVDVNGLKDLLLTALALKVALPSARVDGSDVIYIRKREGGGGIFYDPQRKRKIFL